MYYREIATKSGHKISAKRRSFNCAVLPNIKKPSAHRDLGETRCAEDFTFHTAKWENCDMGVPLDSHVKDIL